MSADHLLASADHLLASLMTRAEQRAAVMVRDTAYMVNIMLARLTTAPCHALLVLDLDETLIGNTVVEGVAVQYARPNVQQFLSQCFSNYKWVAIWSAGTRQWIDEALALPQLRPFKCMFINVWDRTVCEPDRTTNSMKPLSRLWGCPMWQVRGIGGHNTIIVDDNKRHARSNPQNFLLVRSYVPTQFAPLHPFKRDYTLINVGDRLTRIAAAARDSEGADLRTLLRTVG